MNDRTYILVRNRAWMIARNRVIPNIEKNTYRLARSSIIHRIENIVWDRVNEQIYNHLADHV